MFYIFFQNPLHSFFIELIPENESGFSNFFIGLMEYGHFNCITPNYSNYILLRNYFLSTICSYSYIFCLPKLISEQTYYFLSSVNICFYHLTILSNQYSYFINSFNSVSKMLSPVILISPDCNTEKEKCNTEYRGIMFAYTNIIII